MIVRVLKRRDSMKKIIGLVLIFAILFGGTACSSEAKGFFNEVKKVDEWQGYNLSGQLELSLSDKSANTLRLPVQFKLECTGQQKSPLYHLTLEFGTVEGAFLFNYYLDELSGKKFEYYFDQKSNQLLMNKAMFNEARKITSKGQNFPTPLNRVDEAYLAIDLDEAKKIIFKTDLGALISQACVKRSEVFGLIEKYFSDFNLKGLSVSPSNKAYHYEIKDEALLEESTRLISHLVKVWPNAKTEVLPLLKSFGLDIKTDEVLSLEKQLHQLKSKESYKKSYKASYLSYDVLFNEGEVTTNGSLNLGADNQYKAKLNFKFMRSRKVAIKVALPQSVYQVENRETFLKLLAPVVALEKEALVSVDGRLIREVGFVQDGRTLIPFRGFCEAIGAKVDFDNTTKTIKVKKTDKTLQLALGQKKAMIDSKSFDLDTFPVLKNDKTYVPVRFIGEAFGYKVSWDKAQLIAILEEE